MGCDTYAVYVGEILAAKGMSIEYAKLFAEAIFNKFWDDPDITVTIKKEVSE